MFFHMRFVPGPSFVRTMGRYGWMGVDLFFVLSGYLIGSQLLRPYSRGEAPSIPGFYFRRAFRILPAYLAVLLLYFAVPPFREAPGMAPAWQFLTFTENLRVDYLQHKAFSHVWSLCVEEHFYLILPLLVVMMMRRPGKAKPLALIAAILCTGIGIRAYVYGHNLLPLKAAEDGQFFLRYTEQIYYPTYTRLDGLLAGVTLAVIKTFRRAWWERLMLHSHALLCVGLLTTGGAMWLFRDRFGYTAAVVGFPLLSLGLAMIVGSATTANGLLGRFRGFGWLAALAYSLYLTHKEIVHLDFEYLPSLTQKGGWLAPVTYFVTSFAAAAVLYLCIERPFLNWRERLTARSEAVKQTALVEAG